MAGKIDAYRHWNTTMNTSMIRHIRSVIAEARMHARNRNMEVNWSGVG
jgi:hypothetical protein